MALEFFRQFQQADGADMLNGATGKRYRREVLEPGGSRPARALVKAFLGEEHVTMDAFEAWLGKEYAG